MTKQIVASIKIRSVSDGNAWGWGPTRAKKWPSTRAMLACGLLWLCAVAVPLGQDRPAKNPHEGNEDSIRSGMGFFRRSCADCHGMDARGYRAPDLTEVVAD